MASASTSSLFKNLSSSGVKSGVSSASSVNSNTLGALSSALKPAANPYYNAYPSNGITNNEFSPTYSVKSLGTPMGSYNYGIGMPASTPAKAPTASYPSYAGAFTPTTSIFGSAPKASTPAKTPTASYPSYPTAYPSYPSYPTSTPAKTPTATAPKPASRPTAAPQQPQAPTQVPSYNQAAPGIPAAQPQQQQPQQQPQAQPEQQAQALPEQPRIPAGLAQIAALMAGSMPQQASMGWGMPWGGQKLPFQAGMNFGGDNPYTSHSPLFDPTATLGQSWR